MPKIFMIFLALLMVLLVPRYSWAAPMKRLVIIGDSLTEGYGVKREEAYPALLQEKLTKAGKDWLVVNSGISGSTSASAASRVTWQLKQKPDLILLALGANDGLRGVPVDTMEKNLAEALRLCAKASVKVVLVGNVLPPNYGEDYCKKFAAVFPRLARQFSITLIPVLVDKVGGQVGLNQEDGIHPNAKGHAILADTVFQGIKKFL